MGVTLTKTTYLSIVAQQVHPFVEAITWRPLLLPLFNPTTLRQWFRHSWNTSSSCWCPNCPDFTQIKPLWAMMAKTFSPCFGYNIMDDRCMAESSEHLGLWVDSRHFVKKRSKRFAVATPFPEEKLKSLNSFHYILSVLSIYNLFRKRKSIVLWKKDIHCDDVIFLPRIIDIHVLHWF